MKNYRLARIFEVGTCLTLYKDGQADKRIQTRLNSAQTVSACVYSIEVHPVVEGGVLPVLPAEHLHFRPGFIKGFEMFYLILTGVIMSLRSRRVSAGHPSGEHPVLKNQSLSSHRPVPGITLTWWNIILQET